MNVFRLAALGAMLFLAGCAATPAAKTADPVREVLRAGPRIAVGELTFSREAAEGITADEQAELVRAFRLALEQGLPPDRRATPEESEVWRLDVTITELDGVHPSLNAMTTLLLFVPMDMGGVAFEARIHDGAATVAAFEHHERSSPLDLEGSFSRYGHASRALREWAEGLESL